MSAAKKGKKQSDEHIQKRCKKVYCVELDTVFESISVASKDLYLNSGNVSQCCQGKYKTCGGYHFQFV